MVQRLMCLPISRRRKRAYTVSMHVISFVYLAVPERAEQYIAGQAVKERATPGDTRARPPRVFAGMKPRQQQRQGPRRVTEGVGAIE